MADKTEHRENNPADSCRGRRAGDSITYSFVISFTTTKRDRERNKGRDETGKRTERETGGSGGNERKEEIRGGGEIRGSEGE